jgi:membrane protease YdiL (CAAX protease family)
VTPYHPHRLIVFFSIAYLFTWVCWLPLVAEHRGWLDLYGYTESLATLGQFGPFLAAIMCATLEGHSGLRDLVARLTRWRVKPGLYAFALLFPPLAYVACIELNALLGNQSHLNLADAVPSEWLPHFLYILILGGPLGEEPGWRGYALPRLRARWSALVASILLALAWACWHLPLWWVADVPRPFPVYVVGMIPLTIIFTWLVERGDGSALLALLLHASLNTALVRLPIFPAFDIWIVLLWCVAVVIVSSNRDAWLRHPGTVSREPPIRPSPEPP